MHREHRRSLATSGVALAVHGALFALAFRAGAPSVPTVEGAAEPTPIELTLEGHASVAHVAPVAPLAPGVSGPPDHRAAAPLAGRGVTLAVAAAIGGVAAPSAAGAPSAWAAPEPAGSGAPLMIAMPSDADIGLAGLRGPNPLFAPGMVPHEDRAERSRALGEGMAQAAHAEDARIGLGPEGPILGALEDMTRASLVAERSSATFHARIDERGFLVDLRVLATGSAAAWSDVRDRTKRALAGRKLELRGAKGAALSITVTSDMVLPSGAKGRITPTHERSSVDVHGNGIWDTHTIGRFDLADVAAKPQRVVHARLESFEAL